MKSINMWDASVKIASEFEKYPPVSVIINQLIVINANKC